MCEVWGVTLWRGSLAGWVTGDSGDRPHRSCCISNSDSFDKLPDTELNIEILGKLWLPLTCLVDVLVGLGLLTGVLAEELVRGQQGLDGEGSSDGSDVALVQSNLSS